MNFNEKTIIITGASTGIGYRLAFDLLSYDCRLALVSRRQNLLENFAKENSGCNASILPIKCDVSNKGDVKAAHQKILEEFGTVDIAILNAGIGIYETIENYDSSAAEAVYGTNLFGIIYWVDSLLPDFIKKKDGMIIGVSSLADNRGYSRSSFYSSSKAAVSIYLDGLRVDAKKYGIKTIIVKPGFVKTPMTDKNDFYMPFLMPVEKASKIILNGIQKEKRIIRFPLPTVLGSKLIGSLPYWLYDLIAHKARKKK